MTPNKTRFSLGCWVGIAGSGTTSDPMGVNPNLSPTPTVGQWHQGLRDKYLGPAVADMRQGDRVLVHGFAGQRITNGVKQRYCLSDVLEAEKVAPYLTHPADMQVAWGRYEPIYHVGAILPRDPYLGEPGLTYPQIIHRINECLGYIPPGVVSIDESASAGMDQSGPFGIAAQLAYPKIAASDGLCLEPWMTSPAMTLRADIVCTTGQRAAWIADPSRWPHWAPTEAGTMRRINYIINDTDNTPEALCKVACEIAIRGHVPFVGMCAYAEVVKMFNLYFLR